MTAVQTGPKLTLEQRLTGARRVFVQTLFLNLFTAASKLTCGLLTHSLAMIADGFHSLLDSASNVVGIIAINISKHPPDADHPYGHQKFEAVAAMVISFFLFAASFEVLKEAIGRVVDGTHAAPTVLWISYAVLGTNLLINIGVTTFERRKGLELRSELLLADAQHTKSDVFTSLSVLVALLAVELDFAVLDVIAAVVIVVLIFRAGYHIILTHLGPLVDAAVLDVDLVRELVLEVPGVRACDGIRSRGNADHVFIDLRIQVDPSLSVEEGHRIAHRVEDRLRDRFDGRVAEVLIHVEDVRRHHQE